MTKLIEFIKKQTCLYDVKEPLGSKKAENGWKEVSRQIKQSVERCHEIWLKRLEEYAAYIATKGNRHLTTKIAEMDFVEKDLFQQLERAKILCSGKKSYQTVTAISPAKQTEDDEEDCTIVEPMKYELQDSPGQPITPHGVQQASDVNQPPPHKRARRNAVSDDQPLISFVDKKTDFRQQVEQAYDSTNNPVQPVMSTSTLITASERREVAETSLEFCQSSLQKQPANILMPVNPQLNSSKTSDNVPASLAAFGMYVATTLWKFPEKRRIALKSNIFKMLEQEEFGDC